MIYKNNITNETITVYKIDKVILTELNNYFITLPEANKGVGLYEGQTGSYIPVSGDLYIDKGEIEDSAVITKDKLELNYTLVS